MTFRAKMTISGALFFGGIILFAATVPTFGRRCAQAYEPNSVGYERCIQRLMDGGGVHFVRKVTLEPVTD